MIFESMRMSFENIISNKLRSFLTMLGIVIGVAAIIALITIVQGATSSITDQVTSLGVNKVTVNAMGTAVKQGLDDEDVGRIAALPNISGVSPTVSRRMSIAQGSTILDDVTVQGNNEVYFKNDDGLLKSGRAINILDLGLRQPGGSHRLRHHKRAFLWDRSHRAGAPHWRQDLFHNRDTYAGKRIRGKFRQLLGDHSVYDSNEVHGDKEHNKP